MYKKCPFKGNLPPENAFVHSAASGKRSNVIVIDHIITHHNKNPEHAQKCPFNGNLPAENALVHSAARKRLNVIVIDQIIKLNPEHAQMSIERQLTL